MRKKNIIYGLYLFAITVIALEVILRIYNPFHFRIKGDKIVLNTNKQYIIYNNSIPVIEDTIVHTINSLGFRGPERPADNKSSLSVIAVGGSTTICNYLSDSLTWPHKLYNQLNTRFNIWLNNAGLAGHPTFGHLVLMKDYISKLKPQVVIFLIGCNDLEREDLNSSDKSYMVDKYKNIFTFLSKSSELCNTIANLVRARRAVVTHLTDRYLDLKARKNDTLDIAPSTIIAQLKGQEKYLQGYRKRVEALISECKNNQITPVLVTQPSLLGDVVDSISGVNLGKFRLWGWNERLVVVAADGTLQ